MDNDAGTGAKRTVVLLAGAGFAGGRVMAWGTAFRRLVGTVMLASIMFAAPARADKAKELPPAPFVPCLLYTSDAADE